VHILETILGRTFEPGTNLRGDVAGARWAFALPSLRQPSIACLGQPSEAAIRRLVTLSDRVDVVVRDEVSKTRLARLAQQRGWTSVRSLVLDDRLDPDHDLVWVVDPALGRTGRGSTIARQAALRYDERTNLGWRSSRLPAPYVGDRRRLSLRLAPGRGEVRTAIPAGDSRVIDFFASHRLEDGWLARALAARGVPFARLIDDLPIGAIGARLGVRRMGRLSQLGDASLGEPPAYLRTAAQEAGHDLDHHGWGLSARTDYPSQKIVFYLFPSDAARPGAIVKVSQDPAGSPLLDTAYRGLGLLADTSFGRGGRTPGPLFIGAEHGRVIIGESAVEGRSFASQSPATADSPIAGDVVHGLIDLACATQRSASGLEVAAALRELLRRFEATYRPTPACRRVLENAIETVDASPGTVPVVFAHGDPGPQNLIVSDSGRVTFLDWENAEPAGMPLWDLFAFLRGFTTWAIRHQRAMSRLAAIERNFLVGTALTPLITDSVERYRRALDLDPALVKPLFFMCWMSLAVREAPRLTAQSLPNGFQARALELMAGGEASPVLGRILQAQRSSSPS
jgi:hypothetical protein